MSIRLLTAEQKDRFNKLAVHPVQSWEWGEFRKEWGNEVIRLGEFIDGKPASVFQLTLAKIPKTPFSVGTVVQGPELGSDILNELKIIAKKKSAIFIKLEPFIAKQSAGEGKFENQIKLLNKFGCFRGKGLYKPKSLWINLTKSEESLLESFSSKTRYNIRLAERKGVVVSEDNSDRAFENYLKLMRETVERQRFYAHSEKYHRLMWKYLHQDFVNNQKQPIARLLTATFKKEVLTAWILFAFHEYLFYPYGASSTKHKNVMASNLMMWEAIRFGKKLGLKTFDLWGKDEGEGYTRFKEGYNPKTVDFVGSWDLPASYLYFPYRLAEHFRWKVLRIKAGFSRPGF